MQYPPFYESGERKAKDMFREMRRMNQRLPEEESLEILGRGSYGVLAVAGDGGYPYAVPLNYLYHAGKIYFHCAKSGHKLDAILREDKVSFCVTAEDRVVPEEFATDFKSVIAFGRAHILEDGPEKREAIERLAAKYSPGLEKEGAQEIARDWDRLCMVALSIEHVTGKEGLKLSRLRREREAGR